MDGLKLSELEIGKEYFLFSRQFNVSNPIIFLGGDKEVYPCFFNATGGTRTVGHYKYAKRKDETVMTIHEFELGLGFSEITTTHQKGRLVS